MKTINNFRIPVCILDDTTYYLSSPFAPSASNDYQSFIDLLHSFDYRFVLSSHSFTPLIPALSSDLVQQVINSNAKRIIFKSLNLYQSGAIDIKLFSDILAAYKISVDLTNANQPDFSKSLNNALNQQLPVSLQVNVPSNVLLQEQYLDKLVDFSNQPSFQSNPDVHNLLGQNVGTKLINRFNFLVDNKVLPILLFVQGSQNYGMATNNSDVDMKSFVVNLDWTRQEFSKVYETEPVQQNFGIVAPELIDVKTPLKFQNVFLKANPSYLEFLFSKSYCCDKRFLPYIKKLYENRFNILKWNRANFIKGILGFMTEKVAALAKPYPSKIELINKFGYDPKQLHHLHRLDYQFNLFKKYYLQNQNEKLDNDVNINPYQIYNETTKQTLINIKTKPQKLSPNEVKQLQTKWTKKINNYFDWYHQWKDKNITSIKQDEIKLQNWFNQEILNPIINITPNLQHQYTLATYQSKPNKIKSKIKK